MASKPRASAKPKNVAKAAKRPSTKVPTKNKAPKAASSPLGKAIDKGVADGEIDADHMVTYGQLRKLNG